MWLDVLAKLGEASTALGIFIALFGAGWTLHDARVKERDSDLLRWQTATIWEIIAKDGPLTFDEIRKAYNNEFVAAGKVFEYDSKALERDRLQIIILRLIESRAIHVPPPYDASNKELIYSILRFDPGEPDSVLNDMLLVLQEIEEQDASLDEPTLRHKLERSGRFLPAQLAQLSKILIRLETSRLIFRDQDGKFTRQHFQRVVVPPGISTRVTPQAPESVAPQGNPQQTRSC
jgi:hypothetical protein